MGIEQLDLFDTSERRTIAGRITVAESSSSLLEEQADISGPCDCLARAYVSGTELSAPQRKYRIPSMSEDPAVHRGMLRKWIKMFHQMNAANVMPLEKGFYQKNKSQLLGMYYEMRRKYNLSLEDITGSR